MPRGAVPRAVQQHRQADVAQPHVRRHEDGEELHSVHPAHGDVLFPHDQVIRPAVVSSSGYYILRLYIPPQ